MGTDSIEASFLSIFALICFFIFLIVSKYAHKIRGGVLFDKDFSKPQAFHDLPVTRSGGIAVIISLSISLSPSYSKGKIYGESKTLSKEYIKYENCRLKKTEINIKDGAKDGYKCIFKRQGKGKDVTVFQPSPVCQKSFKCKTESQ